MKLWRRRRRIFTAEQLLLCRFSMLRSHSLMVLDVDMVRTKLRKLTIERISLGVMTSTNEILEFIHRRFSHDCNWLNGNCLWFALILKKRFPNVEIFYLPIQGHFVVKSENKYFDWTGIVTPQEEPWSLSKIKKEDDLLYNYLLRDCFY